jgi:hypothetical protein
MRLSDIWDIIKVVLLTALLYAFMCYCLLF